MDGEWELGWEAQGLHLGTGGQDCVFLYRRYRDGNVVERVGVKDSLLSASEWSTFYWWHPDVRDLATRTPMEVHCLETLRDKTTGAEARDLCIVIRGSRVDKWNMWY